MNPIEEYIDRVAKAEAMVALAKRTERAAIQDREEAETALSSVRDALRRETESQISSRMKARGFA